MQVTTTTTSSTAEPTSQPRRLNKDCWKPHHESLIAPVEIPDPNFCVLSLVSKVLAFHKNKRKNYKYTSLRSCGCFQGEIKRAPIVHCSTFPTATLRCIREEIPRSDAIEKCSRSISPSFVIHSATVLRRPLGFSEDLMRGFWEMT